MWDMVRSLGLIAVIIAVTLIFVPGLVHPSKSDRFQAVDYSDYVSGFAQVTGQAALVPAALPSGWTANAGQLTGPAAAEHLHIGWATPGSEYAALEESVAPMKTLVATVLGSRGATVTGSVPIGDAQWQTRTSSRGEYSLSSVVGDISIVITGSASPAEQQLLATSLQPGATDATPTAG
jgi:Protein of unknown function (DUF4245)